MDSPHYHVLTNCSRLRHYKSQVLTTLKNSSPAVLLILRGGQGEQDALRAGDGDGHEAQNEGRPAAVHVRHRRGGLPQLQRRLAADQRVLQRHGLNPRCQQPRPGFSEIKLFLLSLQLLLYKLVKYASVFLCSKHFHPSPMFMR
jgi:hypothetical protein